MKEITRKQSFWRRVSIGDGCWNWLGTKNSAGYGFIRIAGKQTRAHRYSYENTFGKISGGLFVCHKCDNPSCVKPDHLFLGTVKDNCADMIIKGRNMHKTKPWTLARGEKNGAFTKPETVRKAERIAWSKLTSQDVVQIRDRYWRLSECAPKLAAEFNVIKNTICKAIYGLTWKSVPMSNYAPLKIKKALDTPTHLQRKTRGRVRKSRSIYNRTTPLL